MKLIVDVDFGASHFCGPIGTDFRLPYFGFKNEKVYDQTHVKAIHLKIKYKCDPCAKIFQCESSLTYHRKLKHIVKQSKIKVATYPDEMMINTGTEFVVS